MLSGSQVEAGNLVFHKFSMQRTTCEGQNFIETLWETIFSSYSRERPNRILPNLAHLLILYVFTSETFTPNFIQIRLVVLKKKIPENGPIRIS
jgi:tRNA (Thr-GGU) A37 N-methylase